MEKVKSKKLRGLPVRTLIVFLLGICSFVWYNGCFGIAEDFQCRTTAAIGAITLGVVIIILFLFKDVFWKIE